MLIVIRWTLRRERNRPSVVAAAAKASNESKQDSGAPTSLTPSAQASSATASSTTRTATGATAAAPAPGQPAAEPEQTAALSPATQPLPAAKYDGKWEGKASTRFGTQCKSGYNIDLQIGDANVSGMMVRSSERYSVSGSVNSSGTIQDLEGFFRVKVLFKVKSATADEISGTWDMGSKSDYGGSPCRGVFTITKAGG